MKVGYIRVSTEEQNTERQEALMRELGAGKVFMEKATGNTREDRAQLEAMLQYVREGMWWWRSPSPASPAIQKTCLISWKGWNIRAWTSYRKRGD